MSDKQNGRVVESAQEARGAEKGPTVSVVLAVSLTLVIIAFAGLWLLFFTT